VEAISISDFRCYILKIDRSGGAQGCVDLPATPGTHRKAADLHQTLQIERMHRQLLLLGLADYPQVDMLGLRYNPVNFGAGKSPGAPHQ